MNTPVRELLPGKSPITAKEDDKVSDALMKLKANDIICLPVMSKDNNILGFVDLLDLVAFLYHVSTRLLTTTDYGESRMLTTDDLHMLGRRAKEFNINQLRDVIDLSKRNTFNSLRENASLGEAIELFKNRIHRLAILDDKNQLVGILSQLDVIHWLSANSQNENVKNLLKSAQELKSSEKENLLKSEKGFVSVKWDEPVIHGFMKMHDACISAVAIVNDKNEVGGILSASDLKGLSDNDFQVLRKPVREFLENIRKSQSKSADYLVTCSADCSLNEALEIVNRENVHRVLIVDKEKKPTGVITITDMFNMLFQRGQQTVSK